MVQVNCNKCDKEFYVKPSHQAMGYGKYCSRSCAHISARKGKMVECSICGKESYKQKKALGRSKSNKFFCSKSCQTLWRNQLYIGEKHSNYKNGMFTYRAALIRSGEEQICRLCRTTDLRILAVHHIDQDRSNNNVDNLAFLCHNCHQLVHHHKVEYEKFMATIV